jgi:hypothetical protein
VEEGVKGDKEAHDCVEKEEYLEREDEVEDEESDDYVEKEQD